MSIFRTRELDGKCGLTRPSRILQERIREDYTVPCCLASPTSRMISLLERISQEGQRGGQMTSTVKGYRRVAGTDQSRRIAPRILLQLGWILIVPMMANSASADIQTNDECTPTKTIQLDLPGFNWRDSEKQDRDRYGAQGQRDYSVVELESMISRPNTVTELLQNFKIAVDRDLVTQRHFFETRVMQKFFNSSSVTWSSEAHGRARSIVRSGVIKPVRGPFDGYQIKVQLVLDEVPVANVEAYRRLPDHLHRHGTVDLAFLIEHRPAPVAVKSVVDIFGPPPLALRQSCPEAAKPDPGCKGVMVYDYSQREIPGALGGNTIEFEVRKDAVERVFSGWERRTAEGRQRFLCDEDELRHISVDQRY
jgi:hypothetical protein